MPVAVTSIRHILQTAPAPVSLSALAKRTRLSPGQLHQALEHEMTSGAIHRWPDLRRQQRFWHVAPETHIREQILAAASERALPPTALTKAAKKRSHGYPEKLVSALVQQLARDKHLRKYAPFGREKQILGAEGYPAAYAAAARSAILQILDKAAASGADLPQIRALLTPQTQAPSDLGEEILRTMDRIEPSPLTPVSVRELREALPSLDKAAFDHAALKLRDQQRVMLSRHDFPQGMPDHERALLIDGKDGAYYVAITARPH